jgi:murein L,D-transpeptidase YafK
MNLGLGKLTHISILVWCALGVSFHFATAPLCFASEASKTVEGPDPSAIEPPPGKLPTALLSLSSDSTLFSRYAFLVDKSKRTLTVWERNDEQIKLIGSWPTDIGKQGGDKLVQGDHRTPEGIYFFQTAMDGRKVNFDQYGVRIFTLDYPNYFDRLEKKSGNGIWFHAIPDSKSLLRGSRGCVVVRNTVIDELAKFVELKRTPMLIVNQVEYVDPTDWQSQKTAMRTWLESWRDSWGKKNLASYMAQYSERFTSNGMNKARWRRYKQGLAARYEFISVTLKDVQIFTQGPKVVFRFLQGYRSDQKEDFGTKILYAQKVDGKFEIVGETWEPIEAPTTTLADDGTKD